MKPKIVPILCLPVYTCTAPAPLQIENGGFVLFLGPLAVVKAVGWLPDDRQEGGNGVVNCSEAEAAPASLAACRSLIWSWSGVGALIRFGPRSLNNWLCHRCLATVLSVTSYTWGFWMDDSWQSSSMAKKCAMHGSHGRWAEQSATGYSSWSSCQIKAADAVTTYQGAFN